MEQKAHHKKGGPEGGGGSVVLTLIPSSAFMARSFGSSRPLSSNRTALELVTLFHRVWAERRFSDGEGGQWGRRVWCLLGVGGGEGLWAVTRDISKGGGLLSAVLKHKYALFRRLLAPQNPD